MTYWQLFSAFFITGLFSFGGGLAVMPFLYAMTDQYPWFSRELLVDMVAVSEASPGPIGINMATYAGFTAGGIPGGLVASLAIILPSVFIMAGLVRALERFKENKYVLHAFYGLRPAVTALIASAGLGVAALTLINRDGESAVDIRQLLLFAALLAVIRLYKKIQPLYVIAAAGIIGAVAGM